MIKQMTKYTFVIFYDDVAGFLSSMQELGLMDITRQSKPIDAKSSDLFSTVTRCKEALKNLRGAKEEFEKKPLEGGAVIIPTLSSELLTMCESTFARKRSLLEDIKTVKEKIASASLFGDFRKEDIARLAEAGYKAHFFAIPKKKSAVAEQLLNEYPSTIINESSDKIILAVVAPIGAEIEGGVPEIQLPDNPVGVERENLNALERNLRSCDSQIVALTDATAQLEKYLAECEQEADLYLAGESSTKEAENKLEVFTGFAPTESDDAVGKYLDEHSEGVYYIRQVATKEDNPPIALRSNRYTKLFTLLTDMYGRPSYDEFDPTPYISIFFLLFFAMCMGDAGYGILLIIAGFILKRKKGIGEYSPLVISLGLATFIVGIILHTFFGVDISQVGFIPSWLKKCMVTGSVAGYDSQMVLSVAIGVVHISIALILKTIYTIRKAGFVNSLGTIGWTLLIVGGVIIGAIALTGVINSGTTKIVIITLGIISALGIFLFNDLHRNPLKNIGSGLWETYNTVTGLLGDVLSYIRLYALGLAGGMLGAAFNQLGVMIYDGVSVPGLNYILFAVILIFGHVLNLAMCCLGAFVHPLRLNFLEFFKNSGYEGSGRKYKPLTNNSK